MTPEQWRQVTALIESAAEAEPAGRAPSGAAAHVGDDYLGARSRGWTRVTR